MGSSDSEVREWHRDLVETSPVPIAVYDADRVLRYVNDSAVEFVNADEASAVVGRKAAEFAHPDDRDAIERRVEQVLDERESVPPLEARFVATDGEDKHAVTAGAPVTYEGEVAGQAVLNDITGRKRREEQLRQERNRFELLFENLPSPVVYGVARNGEPIVERVNERFEVVFGYSRDQIEGDNLDEYVVPPDKQEEAVQLNERILSEGYVQTEVTRETAHGQREFLLDIVMDDLTADLPEGYAIYTDITEKKRTERELERQNERLEEFVSMVAHDLRNPLNVATAAAEMVQRGADGDHIDRILRAHDRMERIIDDLLTLARQGEAIEAREPVDLATVANRAWETVQTGDAELQVVDTRQILADRSRLQELFENLFRNAVEHGSTNKRTQSGDGVHGSTTADSQLPGDSPDHGDAHVVVECGTLQSGFYVADDGPGIPANERDEVFESGYSTEDEGTGFGLTIVQRIAEAHEWKVSITDSDSGGARFEITGIDA